MAILPITGKMLFAAFLKNSLLVCILFESFVIEIPFLEYGRPIYFLDTWTSTIQFLLRIGCSSTFACIIAVTATIISTIATARLFAATIATM